MEPDWRTVDRWLMGEAWTGSGIRAHARVLCEDIGPRWASSDAERRAAVYLCDRFRETGLENADLEPFDLETWAWTRAEARVAEDGREIDLLPFNRCPSLDIEGPIVDAGYGTPHEVERVRDRLPGAVAVTYLTAAPFSTPVPLAGRLRSLTGAGARVVVVIESKTGRRMEYHGANDWRETYGQDGPFPAVTTSREHGALLRRLAAEGRRLRVGVESRFYTAETQNVACTLEGGRWPEEHLLLGGHHDTVYGAAGGNDNASGTIAVLETARVLAGLRDALGVSPGRSIRFATYSAEEQGLRGAAAYVARHYGPEVPPRLAVNLDELSTGPIKGIVLGFPHLRDQVQAQLDTMADGLACHVMAQIDASSDHFPFLRQGIDAAHLWRWRFVGRHADSDFHHEPGDTVDKLNVRELKEYVGQLARLLLRLSHVPPEAWPENPMSPEGVQEQLEAERGSVVRVF